MTQQRTKYEQNTNKGRTKMRRWKDLLPEYLDYITYEKALSKDSLYTHKKYLTLVSKSLPFPFTMGDLRSLVRSGREKGNTPAYLNFNITVLNSFMRWCQLEKLPQEDLSKDLNSLRPRVKKVPKAKDLLSIEEVTLLLTSPQRNYCKSIEYFKSRDTIYTLLFSFIYKTACRSGEAVMLKKKDFNFSNHSVTFLDTKTGDDRTVAIPPDMEESLIEYVKDLSDSDYLFTVIYKGQPKVLNQDSINHFFKERAKLQSILRPVHIHMLRHSSITHMQLQGCPLATVQRIAGHKSISTTQLYTHVMVEDQREAMLRYNPLIKSQNPGVLIKLIKDFIGGLQLDPGVFNFTTDNELRPTQLQLTLKDYPTPSGIHTQQHS